MKNKTTSLLLLIVLLGYSSVIACSAESSNDNLPLNEVWTFQANDRILATPILINDQIIFRTADKIYSISALNGSLNWEIAARASTITINVNLIGKPIVGNSEFLVSEEQDNSIGIYSTKTGEKIWSVEGQINDINALEIVDDIMVVARHDGNLEVYDLASQQKLWDVPLPPRSFTPIAITSDSVIVGMTDVLHVYDLKHGNLLNEKPYAESLVAEITLSGSDVFVSHAKEGGDWTISSLQLDSLDTNWVFHVGKINHPYLSHTSDYISLFNQSLVVLDANRGNIMWQDNTQKYYSAPAFNENSLYFISRSTQGMFGKEQKICKAPIGEGVMGDCSVIDGSGSLLGPLVTGGLLIVPQGSEIIAFTMP